MSEMFDKSQMSETIDVPAGCILTKEFLRKNNIFKIPNLFQGKKNVVFLYQNLSKGYLINSQM